MTADDSNEGQVARDAQALAGFLTAVWAMRCFLATQALAKSGPVTLATLAETVDNTDPAPAVEQAAALAEVLTDEHLAHFRDQLAPTTANADELPVGDLIDRLRRAVPDPGVALAMVELHVPQPVVDYLMARLDTRDWTPDLAVLRAGRSFILDWIDLTHGRDVLDAWDELTPGSSGHD